MCVFSFTDYIIDKQNLKNNIKFIKSKLKQNTQFCAVVKANAYGAGLNNVIKIIDEDVDCYAVANLQEGIVLRNLGVKKQIITLSALNFEFVNEYCEKFLCPPVSSVLEMSKLSQVLKMPLQVEFALNTGMNRIGFKEKQEINTALNIQKQNKNICLWGVFSHLATKENDVDFMYKQKEKFDKLLFLFKDVNIVRHLSNTNAAINHNDFNYDMVRVGFGMYGMDGLVDGFLPVISVRSRIVKLTRLNNGESIGYDCTFVAKMNMQIAVVPIGYFDGVGRAVSNIGKVIVCGRLVPIVGRVCMDNIMIDVTNIPEVQIGSDVIILGKENGMEITLRDYAEWTCSSEYEVLARFNNSRMNIIVK